MWLAKYLTNFDSKLFRLNYFWERYPWTSDHVYYIHDTHGPNGDLFLVLNWANYAAMYE